MVATGRTDWYICAPGVAARPLREPTDACARESDVLGRLRGSGCGVEERGVRMPAPKAGVAPS